MNYFRLTQDPDFLYDYFVSESGTDIAFGSHEKVQEAIRTLKSEDPERLSKALEQLTLKDYYGNFTERNFKLIDFISPFLTFQLDTSLWYLALITYPYVVIPFTFEGEIEQITNNPHSSTYWVGIGIINLFEFFDWCLSTFQDVEGFPELLQHVRQRVLPE